MILKLFQGFCMAVADSVPGISGGTVAFILGFYEGFIDALHALFGKDPAVRKPAFVYLLKLGVGWTIGFAASILVLSQMFEQNIYFLSSLFLGLTLASIPFIVLEERKSLAGKWKNLPFFLIGLVLVCCLTAFRTSSASSGGIDFLHLQPMQYGYLILSGALAITAMVLPGVSGSSLLLIMGVYIPAVSAVHSFLHLDFSVAPGLMALIIGILFGIAGSIHFVRAALRKHRSQMLYFILGLMVGSPYAIAMGPTTLSVPKAALSLSTFHPLGFLLGAVILLALERLKKWASPSESSEQQTFMKPVIQTDPKPILPQSNANPK